jgi:hypothetical protein
MTPRPFWKRLISLYTLAVLAAGATRASAGTTGQLLGVVTNESSGVAVVAVKVTAASASGIVTVRTDSRGHFAMLDLAPDTYVVSFESPSYRSIVVSGITIVADGSRTIEQKLPPSSTTGLGSTLPVSSPVSQNFGSSLYAVDAVTQFKTSLAGGGAFVNSAYSALSTVPGVFVAPDQVGFGPNISIRGGEYEEVAFGIDGIPVNQPNNNVPGGPASSLGQQELQVFTGSAPADSALEGLSGVVNQVIRIGSIPGFTSLEASVGGPAFYHQLQFETGGATTNRNFSYYVGLGGYDQTYRFADNFNGRGVGQLFGRPLFPCADLGVAVVPSCYVNGAYAGSGVNAYTELGVALGAGRSYVLGPANLFGPSEAIDRNNIINLHLALPRRDGLNDDLQFLGSVDFLKTYIYDSANDIGNAAYLKNVFGLSGIPYYDGLQLNSPTGEFLPPNYQQLTTPYFFPYSSTDRKMFASIPPGLEDSQTNNQAITKLQYTRSFSENALLKLYGYTDYSDEFQDAPEGVESDYNELAPLRAGYGSSFHSYGFGATFIDQLDAHNQLTVGGSYRTTRTLVEYSTEFLNFFGAAVGAPPLGYVVDGSNPTNGLCYAVTGGPAVSCTSPLAGTATFLQAALGTIVPASGTCGNGPCRYLVTNNGPWGQIYRVTPAASAASIVDDFRPTDRLSIEGGLRVDDDQYEGAVTNDGNPTTTFFDNAFNLDNCVTAQNQYVPRAPSAPCPPGTTPADYQNPTGRARQSHVELEPRLQATLSADRDTIVRASYARVSQPQNSLLVQDDTLEHVVYADYAPYGINSPNRVLSPETSNSYDLSIERAFGRETSLRVTPFYRTTQNQLFGSLGRYGFSNESQQTSRGIEFEFDRGLFDRDGFAVRLTGAYENSFVRFLSYNPYGAQAVDPINAAIADYNAYTSACAAGGKLAGKTQFGSPVCGSIGSGAVASACYSPATSAPDGSSTLAGVAEPCSAAGAVANPYWNAPAQSLIDPNAEFPTYQYVPLSPATPTTSSDAPYLASLALNYKRGPFAVTPLMTLEAGERYGDPETTYGVNPELCSGLAGAVPNDPRYPYGSSGGVGFNATSTASIVNGCASGFVIPNPYTRKFDALGAFVEPGIAQLQIQMSYDVSKNFQIVVGFANVITECFGGSKEPWNVKGACSYTAPFDYFSGVADVGNQYNPGAVIQPFTNTPYQPNFASAPFGFGIGARIKL